MYKTVIAALAMSLVAAGCGGGDSSESDSSSTEAGSTTAAETTVELPTTVAATTTTLAEPEALIEIWVSADDFLTSFEDMSATIAEQNSTAAEIVLDVDYPFGITDEAPEVGTFVAGVNDGICEMTV